MNIGSLSLKYQKPILMLLVLMTLYGLVSYFSLPAREDPEITIREAIVATQFPGMSPTRVEALISKKLEESIRTISEVERIRSTSTTGLSIIHVEIADKYFQLDDIWQDLRNKVSETQARLPQGSHPSVVNDDFGDVAILTLALTADGFSMAQQQQMAEHIRDSLYRVNGTKNIEILGIQPQRIYIQATNAKLAQFGVSPDHIARQLQAQNIIQPGGSIDTGLRTITIEPSGNFDSVEALKNTLISIPKLQQPVVLQDIAEVKLDYIDPPHHKVYHNGQPALVFAISMLSGFNVLEYSPRLEAAIDDIQQTLPIGYELSIVTRQAEQVEQTVYGVSANVLQTLAIVLVVVMLFLGMRTGLIVGSIVPIVMLITLAVMSFIGINLERMSLATLIIALGLLVDNGIVIAEDFKRRLEQGQSRREALSQSPTGLAIPLLSSSVSTILFFLPLMLAQHAAGEYTRSISLVILISLMASWLLAIVITPLLCYHFLKVDNTDTTKGLAFYQNALQKSFQYKKSVIMLVLLMFALAIVAMSGVKKQFFPDSDRAQVLVYLELEPSASSKATDTVLQHVFTWLQQNKTELNYTTHAAYVGFGGPRFVLSLTPNDPAPNKAFMVINYDSAEELDTAIEKLRTGFAQHFPWVSARVTKMFLGPSDSSEIKIQVKGPDEAVIYDTAQQIKAYLSGIDGTIDIRDDWQGRITAIKVKIDQHKARQAGVTSTDVAERLQGYFDGVVLSEYREQDTIIPIVYRATHNERHTLDRLRTASVYASNQQQYVPLLQIAEFEPMVHFASIQKEDLFKTISIEARHLTHTAEDLKQHVNEKLNQLKQTLPLNHTIEYDGVIKESAEAQKSLAANMPIVLAVVVLLLVLQFNSFRRPLIIILTIPLSFIGAVIGLIIMQAPFGFMVSLGLYSLAGIIINNAIVLIDKIDQLRTNDTSLESAIIKACSSRVRPILMTTVTTILGLMPLILTKDPLFYGLACVLAFGLAIGTLLTLGVVPILYKILFSAQLTNQK
ncbi:acriflavin resistance protein [Catenovulum agarivorans DS-2]|uniref:Acriflavin resistance protein n=1 Tax=Catenovulum agarivorans DS-2 TaxID=1328313 RepID=W7R3H6_9ALTE|nr:efflux RND transporter permease subunit [Catenovulum agarivorans]EWH12175.1 acriflavin resistance protein [Catenovulum agarivorans DS-2]